MKAASIVPIVFGMIACSEPMQPATYVAREGAPVQTDTTEYTARHIGGEGNYRRYGFELVTRFYNAHEDTVFLGRCYPDSPIPIYGVEAVDSSDRWGAAYSPTWACVGHENPIAVAPGATRVDTLQLVGPTAFDGRTGEPFGVLTGEFRLGYSVNSCRREVGCELQNAGVSNVFRVAKD